MSDLIDRQAAIDLFKKYQPYMAVKTFEFGQELMKLPPAPALEQLKAEIYKLKHEQDSPNRDYYTGYMCALSTVEGIIAGMEMEDEAND